jgi:hypothetical protein
VGTCPSGAWTYDTQNSALIPISCFTWGFYKAFKDAAFAKVAPATILSTIKAAYNIDYDGTTNRPWTYVPRAGSRTNPYTVQTRQQAMKSPFFACTGPHDPRVSTDTAWSLL